MPTGPDQAHTCPQCGAVYKVVDMGFATRLIARPDATRGNVGRRFAILGVLVFLAVAFFVMGLCAPPPPPPGG